MIKVWVACTFLVLLLASCTTAPSMLVSQGPEARSVATLAWWVFAVAAIILLVVVVLLLVALLRQRPKELTPVVRINDRRSLTWVLIGGLVAPLAVLAILIAFSVSVTNAEANQQPPASAPVIEVIGHRWWWEVFYPNSNVVTANEIHIPVGQPVVFKLTSADVIHGFWVPQLHGKVDMIPGQTNTATLQADQAGSYHGECAEFCGMEHAKMDLVVIAEPLDQYNAWLAQQTQPAANPPPGTPEKKGQQALLGSACVYCHTVSGTNASGTLGPNLTHLASRSTIGAGILPNTPTNLAGWIANSQSIKPGNVMPPMDLDAEQIQQLLTYLATLK